MNFTKEKYYFRAHLSLFLSVIAITNVYCNTSNNGTKGKEKVSTLLQSAILFHNAAKNIEDKLNRLQNYKPYERGMQIMKGINDRISHIYTTMEEIKNKAEEHPAFYATEIEKLLNRIESENDEFIDITKLLENPQKYYDENEIVQKIKQDRDQLSEDLKSFDSTARGFMQNVDALEENKIYLYTLEESDIKFDFSVMEKLLEMYEQVEKFQEQLEPYGENIPKDMNRVRNSLNILTQIEIPTFVVNNGKMLENFVPSIIRAVEQTQQKYSSVDNSFDTMFATFMEEVNANKIQLEKFLHLIDELKLMSDPNKILEKDEL